MVLDQPEQSNETGFNHGSELHTQRQTNREEWASLENYDKCGSNLDSSYCCQIDTPQNISSFREELFRAVVQHHLLLCETLKEQVSAGISATIYHPDSLASYVLWCFMGSWAWMMCQRHNTPSSGCHDNYIKQYEQCRSHCHCLDEETNWHKRILCVQYIIMLLCYRYNVPVYTK